MSLRSRNDEHLLPLSVVRWPGVDGVPVSSYPLPRPLAEAVARAFAATSPRESFWVEDISWLPSGAPASRAPEPTRAAAPVARSAVDTSRFVAP